MYTSLVLLVTGRQGHAEVVHFSWKFICYNIWANLNLFPGIFSWNYLICIRSIRLSMVVLIADHSHTIFAWGSWGKSQLKYISDDSIFIWACDHFVPPLAAGVKGGSSERSYTCGMLMASLNTIMMVLTVKYIACFVHSLLVCVLLPLQSTLQVVRTAIASNISSGWERGSHWGHVHPTVPSAMPVHVVL